MLDKRLLRKIDFYYKIARLTVLPDYLGGDLGGNLIHYSDEGDEGKEPILEGISSTEKEIPSTGGRANISPIEEYRSYFGGTDIPYHIIFTNYTFDLGKYGLPVEDFKEKLEGLLRPDSKDVDQRVKEKAEYLLDNWNKLFSNAENSVTILANDLDINDAKNPLALDHDIGHHLLGGPTELFDQFFSDSLPEKIIDAISKDYEISVKVYTEKEYHPLLDDVSSFLEYKVDLWNTIIMSLFFINNPIPGAISTKNISESSLQDLFPDMMLYHRKQGGISKFVDSLSPIDIYYTDMGGMMATNPQRLIDNINKSIANIPPTKYDWLRNLSYKIYKIAPKKDIPNIKKVFLDYAREYDKTLSNQLEYIKGRVVPLW